MPPSGQNALSQVGEFQKVAGVTGLVMTKLDGTARGGILVAIAGEICAAGAFHRRRRERRRSRAVRSEGFCESGGGDGVSARRRSLVFVMPREGGASSSESMDRPPRAMTTIRSRAKHSPMTDNDRKPQINPLLKLVLDHRAR